MKKVMSAITKEEAKDLLKELKDVLSEYQIGGVKK